MSHHNYGNLEQNANACSASNEDEGNVESYLWEWQRKSWWLDEPKSTTTTTHLFINAVNALSGTDDAQTIMFLLKRVPTPTCMKGKLHPIELCMIVLIFLITPLVPMQMVIKYQIEDKITWFRIKMQRAKERPTLTLNQYYSRRNWKERHRQLRS